MNENKLKPNESPFIGASLFSKLTFSWLHDQLFLGRKKQLELTDLYSPLPDMETTRLTDQMEQEWAYERKNHQKPKIHRVIYRLYRKRILLNALFILLQDTFKILIPLLLEQILKYFSGTIELSEAIIYTVAIGLVAVLISTLHHPYYFNTYGWGIKCRVACSGLVYRKALNLSVKSLDQKSSGDIINLLSTDMARLENGFTYWPHFASGVLQLVFVIVFILIKINGTFLAGLMILALLYPVKYFLAKFFQKFMIKNCAKSDERVSLLTEILNSIKIVKMYCWESIFSERVTLLRNQELKYRKVLNLLQSMTVSIDAMLATLMTLINVVFFINFSSLPLLPSFTTYAIGFYMRLCTSCGFSLTKATISVVNMKVSMDRVTEFLMMPELEDTRLSLEEEKKESKDNLVLSMENFNFNWSKDEFGLKNINIKAERGQLVAIVGSVGSGKTSILLGLLGELENYRGLVRTCGRVFYVSQQPWIFPASLKQNILFGNEYNKEKFDKIVQVCSLKKDLEMLAYGAETLIGEKGINLSGGQRARVNMARALYAEADIYLFDDSLSAVDGTVAKNLIKDCINGHLKEKTRILVTHQVHHLESADKIYVLKDGSIEASGTYQELLESHLSTLSAAENSQNEHTETIEENIDSQDLDEIEHVPADQRAKQEQFQKDREEKQKKGAVSIMSYLAYFTAGWGYFGLFVVLIFFLASQGLVIASDYWLADWASKEERFERLHVQCSSNATYPECEYFYDLYQNTTYLVSSELRYNKRIDDFHTYLILTCISFSVLISRSILFFMWCVSNSRKVYEKLFHSVRDTYVRFFELNPIGRILNRFSKDTHNMDEMLVLILYEFMHLSLVLGGSVVLSLIVNPWMLIPLSILGVLFYFLQSFFVPSAREMKRLDNIARSPIFVHTNSSLEGICTVRSYNKKEILIKEFDDYCDLHTRANYGFLMIHRWFGLRLDALCCVYTIITLFACVFLKDNLGLESGEVGLLVVYLFQLFDLFQWSVVLYTTVDNIMTSIERIVEYTNIPSEPLNQGNEITDKSWPNAGEIVLDQVSLSYDENLPDVLKKISLYINPGEKVGIVGRTGAGKSSFFQILFRMYEPKGLILIDGVNTRKLKLLDLREKLTIIPQEPVLFSGTVRFNLDPYQKYSEKELWGALESVSLKSIVESLNGGLDSTISSSGTNLSVGQKQLICLARAILKKTKILIIDEATANVDYQTDAIIQKTIREQFKECTVLTIAHRLATVVDNDRILCMSEGKVTNFGKPRDLLEDQSSVLYELTKKLSPNERKLIFELAGCNQYTSQLSRQNTKEKIEPVEYTVDEEDRTIEANETTPSSEETTALVEDEEIADRTENSEAAEGQQASD